MIVSERWLEDKPHSAAVWIDEKVSCVTGSRELMFRGMIPLSDQGPLADRCDIAKAALVEAGFNHLAMAVKPNRAGDPMITVAPRTDEELLAIKRAFRLGHMGDEEGKVVGCCMDPLIRLMVDHEMLEAYTPACDHCLFP